MVDKANILYSFRRCPYAIRARLALSYSGVTYELREVSLKNKPEAMLSVSAKGTVPVLVLSNGRVLDESLEVMRWALSIHDPENWLASEESRELTDLVSFNDRSFKPSLDRFKYPNRYPEADPTLFQRKCEEFLVMLEEKLSDAFWLINDQAGLADYAIFPFVRQLAGVDRAWFYSLELKKVATWLERLLVSPLFLSNMEKHPPWQPTDKAILYG